MEFGEKRWNLEKMQYKEKDEFRKSRICKNEFRGKDDSKTMDSQK